MYDRPLARWYGARLMSAFIRVVVDWRLLLFELVLSFVIVPHTRDPQNAALASFGLWMAIALVGAAREAMKKQLRIRDAVKRLRLVPAKVYIEIAFDNAANNRFAYQLRSLFETAGWRVEMSGAWLTAQPVAGLSLTYSARSTHSESYRTLAEVLAEMGYPVEMSTTDQWDEVEPERAELSVAEPYP